jgi:hypothetical protein
MMAGRKAQVHTTPNPDGSGWVNQVGGKIVSTHRLKERAVDQGRETAKARHTEHAILNHDGQIGRKNSYGGDSNPPKDKNR